ncbi:MAG: glutathione ABC transporter substrate-binding protein [Bacillota bacterium]|nr:glutathione ABC transporter substrate-binding protein [Bacillota bacterium]
MRRRIVTTLICSLLAVSMVLAGCGGTAPPAAPAKPAEPPKPQVNIVMAMSTDPKTMDPHKSNDGPSIINWKQMYDTLVKLDTENRTAIPSLATKWEQPDGKTIKFTLRKDVKFHDGTALTAKDVVFSISRLLDPTTKSPAAYLLNMIDTIKADDDYTVTVTLKQPFAPVIFHFAHPAASIVPEAYMKAKGDDFIKAPVGSGPFKFVSYTKGDRIEFVKNAAYWGGAPTPDKVTIRIIPEPSTQVAELEAGGIHIAFNIPTQEVARLKQSKTADVLTTLSWSVQGLVFNVTRKPYNDVRVRQALNYAVDKESIVKFVEAGLAEPTGQILTPVVFGYNPNLKPYPYDPAKAKQLLKAAGYPNGFETKFLVWNMDPRIKFAEAVQAQLAKVGVKVKLDIIEFGTALEMAYKNNFDVTTMQWGTATLDGDYSYYSLIHSDNWGSAGNWGHYKNKQVDDLIMKARTTPDQKVRLESYQKASEIVFNDAVWLFGDQLVQAFGVRRDLKNVKIPVSWINADVTKATIQK